LRSSQPPLGRELGLALVGYRGSGKSTAGAIVATWKSREFFDLDLEIESRAGCSISEIFAREGEAGFRNREEEVLHELLLNRPGAVVATGGGVVLRESNRRALRRFGIVVWLTADPEVLAARLAADGTTLSMRPSLTGCGTLEEISQVLSSRLAYYREVADRVIETGGKTPDEVARLILEAWSPDRAG